jgi:hypothetical protein
MKRTLALVLLLSALGKPAHSSSGSLSESYSKAALQSLQAIETDISTTEQAMKAIFDLANAEAKTDPEKSMTTVLHQVYEQKLIDNRLRQAEFSVLDEALGSSDPLLRDYISKEQIAQYDHDDAEMSKHEAACFESLKKALQNHVSENPKPCMEWAPAVAAPAKKSESSEE